jgi:hypothetical protein
MVPTPRFVVRIEKKPGGSLSEAMSDARSWLDHRKIESASFKTIAEADGDVGFEIGFNSEAEAHLFEREFG